MATQARHAWLTARTKACSAANGPKAKKGVGAFGEKKGFPRPAMANELSWERCIGLEIRKGMIIDKARLESNSNLDPGSL